MTDQKDKQIPPEFKQAQEELTKANAALIARADRAGITQAASMSRLLTALGCAPDANVRIQIRDEASGETVEGVLVVVGLFDLVFSTALTMAERIVQLEALVIGGELREKIGTLEGQIDRLIGVMQGLADNQDWTVQRIENIESHSTANDQLTDAIGSTKDALQLTLTEVIKSNLTQIREQIDAVDQIHGQSIKGLLDAVVEIGKRLGGVEASAEAAREAVRELAKRSINEARVRQIVTEMRNSGALL